MNVYWPVNPSPATIDLMCSTFRARLDAALGTARHPLGLE